CEGEREEGGEEGRREVRRPVVRRPLQPPASRLPGPTCQPASGEVRSRAMDVRPGGRDRATEAPTPGRAEEPVRISPAPGADARDPLAAAGRRRRPVLILLALLPMALAVGVRLAAPENLDANDQAKQALYVLDIWERGTWILPREHHVH